MDGCGHDGRAMEHVEDGADEIGERVSSAEKVPEHVFGIPENEPEEVVVAVVVVIVVVGSGGVVEDASERVMEMTMRMTMS